MSEQVHDKLVRVIEERNGLVDQVASMARTIKGLKGELAKQRADSPLMADAKEVSERWIDRLGKNKRTTFGPARQKAVMARLDEEPLTEGGTRKDDLFEAIEGMRELPFVGPKGRQANPGRGAKRHDDLALICRDETTVERFMGYAADAREAEKKRKGSMLEAAEQKLTEHFGRDLDDDRRIAINRGGLDVVLRQLEERGCTVNSQASGLTSTNFMAQCPAHEDRSPSLSIRELGDGMVLLHCFAGCETEAVVEALGLQFGDLFGIDHDRGPSLDPAHPRWAK